jgi:hypothetical protein
VRHQRRWQRRGGLGLDTFTAREEFAACTDPQLDTSRPAGAGGVNYVPFRDNFDDAQYEDRWYPSSVDPDTLYSLFEAGTELQGSTQQPIAACNGWVLESFAAVDVADAVFHVRLRLDGFGATAVGLVKDHDFNNRLEIRFDNDEVPYLRLRSWEAATETVLPVDAPSAYAGTEADIRIVKNGDQYDLFVDNVPQGTVTNVGLGDVTLRPFIAEESCLADGGFVDSRFDLIEVLLDRDADGLADRREDADSDGAVGAGESDPLDPDTDSDTVRDGFDNCLFVGNVVQRDTNGDGFGNVCDPDLNNDGAVNFVDLGLLKSVFFTANADADLNGDGAVNFTDLGIMKSMFFQAPGPSGVVQ